jgi:hypothetical protein
VSGPAWSCSREGRSGGGAIGAPGVVARFVVPGQDAGAVAPAVRAGAGSTRRWRQERAAAAMPFHADRRDEWTRAVGRSETGANRLTWRRGVLIAYQSKERDNQEEGRDTGEPWRKFLSGSGVRKATVDDRGTGGRIMLRGAA